MIPWPCARLGPPSDGYNSSCAPNARGGSALVLTASAVRVQVRGLLRVAVHLHVRVRVLPVGQRADARALTPSRVPVRSPACLGMCSCM